VNEPGEVKVWDAATGKEILDFARTFQPGHERCFSPDGSFSLALHYMGTIILIG